VARVSARERTVSSPQDIPKALQKLLGHASIKTTMDRYVHVTDASLVNAIKQFENASLAG
jgi:integrase